MFLFSTNSPVMVLTSQCTNSTVCLHTDILHRKQFNSGLVICSLRKDTTSLAFNFHENTIYFAETQTKTISKSRLVAGDVPEVLLGGIGTVDGLSVDWISSK